MHEALMDTLNLGHRSRDEAPGPKTRDNVALDMDKRLDAMRRDMLRGRKVDMLEYEDLLRQRGDMMVRLVPPRRRA